MSEVPAKKNKGGRPRKPKPESVQVKRPINRGQPIKPEAWDGRFQSVEPMATQKKLNHRYKWNHHTTLNWIMGQADPLGFLTKVMQGEEIFPVYSRDAEGRSQSVGSISADPELRVLAAKTLLGKCLPDLKAVEISAEVQTTKVLDITRLSDNDLNAIERVLEHAFIDRSESREDEEIIEGVHSQLLEHDRTRT